MSDLPDGSGLFVNGQPVIKDDVQAWVDAVDQRLEDGGATDAATSPAVASVGEGQDLHSGVVNGALQLKRLTARGASVTTEADGLMIDVANEANAGRNVGEGAALFKGRASDAALEFRKLAGADGVEVTENGDQLVVGLQAGINAGLSDGQRARVQALTPPGTIFLGDQDYPGAGAFAPASHYLFQPRTASITAHRTFTVPPIDADWIEHGTIIRVSRQMLGPGDIWIEGLFSARDGRRYLHIDQTIWLEAIKNVAPGYWRPVETMGFDARVASVDELVEGSSNAVMLVTPARLRQAIDQMLDQRLGSDGGGASSSLPITPPAAPQIEMETAALVDEFHVDDQAYQRDWCAGVEIVTRDGVDKLRIFNRTMPSSRSAHLTAQMPPGAGAFATAMSAWLGVNGVDISRLTTWLGVNGVDVQAHAAWPADPATTPCNAAIREILQKLEAGAFGADPILYNWPGTINLAADAANESHQGASWHDGANIDGATFLGSPTWFVFDHISNYKDGYGWVSAFQLTNCSNIRLLNFGIRNTAYETKPTAKDLEGPGVLRTRGGSGYGCYGIAATGAFSPAHFGSATDRDFADASVTDVRATISAERCQHGVQHASVARSVMNVWTDGRAQSLNQRPAWLGAFSRDLRIFVYARNVESGSNAINLSTNFTVGVSIRRGVITLDYDSPNTTAAVRLRMNAIMGVRDWPAFHISDLVFRGVIRGAGRAFNLELSNQGEGLTSILNASPLPPVVEMRRIAFRDLVIDANGAGIEDDFGATSGARIGPAHHAEGLTIGDFYLRDVTITGGTRWGARFRGLTHPMTLERVVSDGRFLIEGSKADIPITVKDCAIVGGVVIDGPGHRLQG